MTDTPAPRPPSPAIEVVDVPGRYRFEARIDGQVAGVAMYLRRGRRVIFTHTQAGPDFEGRGVGSALAKGALDAVRAAGGTVEARCPFLAAYLQRHPGYADLLETDAALGAEDAPA
jgi:uncharacterized protein